MLGLAGAWRGWGARHTGKPEAEVDQEEKGDAGNERNKDANKEHDQDSGKENDKDADQEEEGDTLEEEVSVTQRKEETATWEDDGNTTQEEEERATGEERNRGDTGGTSHTEERCGSQYQDPEARHIPGGTWLSKNLSHNLNHGIMIYVAYEERGLTAAFKVFINKGT
ncbi:hypothetical protein NDU88_010535 [Pleurodeles waltl]|uniref:Uncharacterized protein n=1 Tax=Pleurodeles waltl TaxID=8319 RepID=A0AAV7Q283_PLEWA|nr:hypothetical protein NDU88_010535 [Pleurodeles waltl]